MCSGVIRYRVPVLKCKYLYCKKKWFRASLTAIIMMIQNLHRFFTHVRSKHCQDESNLNPVEESVRSRTSGQFHSRHVSGEQPGMGSVSG